MKGATWFTYLLAVAICGLMVGMIAIGTGYWKLPFQASTVATTTTATGETVDRCPSGLSTLPTVLNARNGLNTSDDYPPAGFAITGNDAKTIVPSGTGTQTYASTITSTSISIPCTGDVYNHGAYAFVTGDTVVNSAKSTLLKFDGSNAIAYQFDTPRVATLKLEVMDNTFTNTTATAGGYSTITESSATDMSANGPSRDGYLDITLVNGASAYGSKDGGVLFVIDTVDSKAFTDSAITLSSGNLALSEVSDYRTSYPNVASQDSANRVYKSAQITSAMANPRIAWMMRNDGGTSATTTSDPVLYIEDIQYAKYGQTIIQDAFDPSGNNLGASQVSLTWNNT